ncbi:hypothetical protein GN244_ATG05769 [Phytophthora infestans]|uniref:Uncharacterized protein n=1 Tax=Phytophthora infestans TaxID=4787 RepID=A0A833WMA8_PHYIN|nr:hypothetical protein GN244_ATG05769 [Phytophthora infestans]
MSDEIATKKTSANVTGKKRRPTDGNLPLFCLASAALSDEGVTRLHSIVRDTLRTSGIRAFEIFNEAEKVVLVDEGI